MPRGVRIALIGVGFFVVFCGLSLAGVAYAYRGVFYPGTKVGAIDVSGKTEAAGKEVIQNQIDKYLKQTVTIAVADISKPRNTITNEYPLIETSTTVGELGVTFQNNEVVGEAWKTGHTRNVLTWFKTTLVPLFTGTQRSLSFQMDLSKISTFIHTAILPKLVTPVSAKIALNGATATVQASQPGLEIDEAALKEGIVNTLSTVTDGDALSLRASTHLVEATVTAKQIAPVADHLNALAAVKITFTADGITLKPKPEQIISWYTVVQDSQGVISLVLDKNAVSRYLTASNTTIDIDKTLSAVDKVLSPLAADTFNGSNYAKGVGVALTLKPVKTVVVTAGDYTLGKFPGKYIEVNLAEQKLYRINGTTMEKVYRISSGKWSTPTPTGVFTLSGHIRRAYSSSFGLYMPYWINFLNNEYGLHELPEWPNGYKEGAAHIGTPVSHGCVRLGVGDAEEIYNWVPDGTPIYIH